VLKAYSLFDVELGYTQGLNFIAALILLKVDDESLAFVIFIKLLQMNDWRRFYTNETPKLFDMSKLIKKFL
jgi:ecotropic viral integration site 5 protein